MNESIQEDFQSEIQNQLETNFGNQTQLQPHLQNQIHKQIEDFEEEEPMPKLLPRKRSMSKPTDLDEILKMQEAMEKEQSVAEVFANDPFFQSTLSEYNIQLAPSLPPRVPTEPSISINAHVSEPIYANQDQNQEQSLEQDYKQSHVPSLETTQEIDIDAVLGYSDEKAIENIEWPSQEITQTESTSNHLEIDYAKPAKSKKGFFNFGKKSKQKAGKNDEVSYYIEEPQPEPPSEVEVEDQPNENMPEEEHQQPVPTPPKPKEPTPSKPGFF